VFFGEPFDVDPEFMRLKCLFTGNLNFYEFLGINLFVFKISLEETLRIILDLKEWNTLFHFLQLMEKFILKITSIFVFLKLYVFFSYFLFALYRVSLVKTEEKVPRVELEEMGPAMDLIMNRNKISSDDLYKKSKKQPKEITVCIK
jgi:hypothetical protein